MKHVGSILTSNRHENGGKLLLYASRVYAIVASLNGYFACCLRFVKVEG